MITIVITEIGVLVKENEAKEVLKDVDRRASTSKQRSWVGQLAEANNLWTRASLDQKSLFNFTPPNSPSTPPSFPSSTSPGLNREERRLRAKFERERENKTK